MGAGENSTGGRRVGQGRIEYFNRACRNMTATERAYYLGRRYSREKGKEGRPAKKGKLRQGDGVSGETAERIAKEEGVSARTVERAGKFAADLDALCQGGMGWVRVR